MKVGEDMPKLSAGEFLSQTGLLFEINRKILHPFGLALELMEAEDDDGNVVILLGDIDDHRDDPEGITFGEKTFKEGMSKLTKFMEEFGKERLRTRKEALGYIIQHNEQDFLNDSPPNRSERVQSITQKAIKLVGIKGGTEVDVDKFAAATGQDDAEESAYINSLSSQPGNDAVVDPGLSSIEQNMLIKAHAKMHEQKGTIPKAHMKPDGTPCTNPVIVDSKIRGGGSVVFCSTCGTQLKDSDLRNAR